MFEQRKSKLCWKKILGLQMRNDFSTEVGGITLKEIVIGPESLVKIFFLLARANQIVFLRSKKVVPLFENKADSVTC